MHQPPPKLPLLSLPWLEKSMRAAFGEIDGEVIELIGEHLEWITLPGGETLFEQGDQGETLYFLVSGRLRVTAKDELGDSRTLGEVRRGETLGEMALLTGEPRSATVAAVRDSILVGITRHAYGEVLRRHPLVSMHVARFIIERTRRSADLRQSRLRPGTVALLPVTDDVDTAHLAAQLLPRLASHGSACLLDAASAELALGKAILESADERNSAEWQAVSHWIDQMEATHELVLLVVDEKDSAWSRHCLRHADSTLLLVDSRQAVAQVHSEAVANAARSGALRTLVLLHANDCHGPRVTRHWLERLAVDDHLHIRLGHAEDFARLARMLTGNAIGLVLGGGGARGFAHLGVLRALEEAGIPIDMVGGASIGAAIASYIAFDRPSAMLTDLARRSFSRNPTGDYNLAPLISLIGGGNLRRVINEAVSELSGFDAHIEDTWKPLYCVATNYSRATEAVLRRGPLAKSVRASVSIPAALPPVVLDGDLMMDGGTVNNFPTDVMARQGAGFIFGCDLMRDGARSLGIEEIPSGWSLLRDRLRPKRRRRFRLPSLVSIILNVSILHSQSRLHASRSLTDVCFTPPVGRVGMLNWKAFDSVVETGYRHAKEVIAAMPAEQLQRLRGEPAAA